MPVDHFLPATYIAGFSADTNPVRRQRRVWVADKQAGKIFETAASNVCAINDFYTLESSQFDAPRIVDAQFSYYEGPLANAINHLISGVVDAHTWLTVLVRFVAGLLVRGRILIAGSYGDFAIYLEPSWQNSILSSMVAIILILLESLNIRDYSHPSVVPH